MEYVGFCEMPPNRNLGDFGNAKGGGGEASKSFLDSVAEVTLVVTLEVTLEVSVKSHVAARTSTPPTPSQALGATQEGRRVRVTGA